jgi:hypothetical protein
LLRAPLGRCSQPVFRNRAERLDGHANPHELRIFGRQRLIGDPIREGQSAAFPQNPGSLDQRLSQFGYVTKRLLADDSVHAGTRKRDLQYISFNDTGRILKANKLGQFLGSNNAGWSQFNSNNIGSVPMGEIPHCATEPRAEIGNASPVLNLRLSGQLVCRRRTAIMILVMWKQFFWTHRVEVAATSP